MPTFLDDDAIRFSFKVAEQPFPADGTGWLQERSTRESPDGVKVHTTCFRQAANGLAVEEECLAFPDSQAVEWVLRFRNEGRTDSPILSEILPLDLLLERADASVVFPLRTVFDGTAYNAAKCDFLLHYERGGLQVAGSAGGSRLPGDRGVLKGRTSRVRAATHGDVPGLIAPSPGRGDLRV